jgi:two-component system sensor histidine kinase VicK
MVSGLRWYSTSLTLKSMNKPSSLLLTFAEKDHRICFAIEVKTHRFIYLNPAFEAFFNMKRAEANVAELLEFVHPEDKDYLQSIYRSLTPGEFKDNVEFRMILPDRKQYHFRLNAYLHGRAPERGTLTGYLEDITASKEHERKLDDLSNRKNAVLNILSHDLAGPLGAIQNYTYLLSKQKVVAEVEQVAKMISAIEKISKRSTNLIQQLVRNEFLESSGVDVSKVRVNLVEKVADFMNDYYGVQDSVNLNFEFNYSNDQLYAEIDDSKFMQVFNNLISNSMKFTPDGGKIMINMEERQGTILISVADTGIGIPKEFHPHLFDKFNKARRPSLKGEPSVGLGMSIIKTIVDWHNGKIWFESEENKGTTFYIEIPASN